MDTNSTAPEDKGYRRLSYAFLVAGCILLIVAYLVGISDNPPAIVAMLLGGFLIILGLFYRFVRAGIRSLFLPHCYTVVCNDA